MILSEKDNTKVQDPALVGNFVKSLYDNSTINTIKLKTIQNFAGLTDFKLDIASGKDDEKFENLNMFIHDYVNVEEFDTFFKVFLTDNIADLKKDVVTKIAKELKNV